MLTVINSCFNLTLIGLNVDSRVYTIQVVRTSTPTLTCSSIQAIGTKWHLPTSQVTTRGASDIDVLASLSHTYVSFTLSVVTHVGVLRFLF